MLHEIPVRAYAAAAVVVRRARDGARFLLLRRTSRPIGAWTYVAGSIEEGEKAYHAAVREVLEETGLNVSALYSADVCEQFYEVAKKITHREIKDIKGKEFEEYYSDAQEFVDTMKNFINKKI